jgi:hypothetical protein
MFEPLINSRGKGRWLKGCLKPKQLLSNDLVQTSGKTKIKLGITTKHVALFVYWNNIGRLRSIC